MKTQAEVGLGRESVRTCYKLTDEIYRICEAIRYANKPSDLSYPISELIQITRRIEVFREQWLNQWLDARNERLERWPKLWERYL